MFKTLLKVVVVAGTVAGAVHLWRKYEVTQRLVVIGDELLTKFVVGQEENSSQKIQDEDEFLAALREQQEANAAGRRS